MKLIRLVVSDLHLGSGAEEGRLNPHEDFFHDEHFAELLAHYVERAGDREIELILNGDIFDLLKIKIDGRWPTEITEEVASEKLRVCLEGHPRFVRALRDFLSGPRHRIVYLPGNHDLDMCFPGAQELFRRYVAPGALSERVRFITASDTYYLPEGIQVRHGHQLENIHRVDYGALLRTRADGKEILDLPYGSLWVLEVLNPAKEERHAIDRIQPLKIFIIGSLFFDPRFGLRFLAQNIWHFLKRRIFTFRAWSQRLRNLPRILREEIYAMGSFDDAATRYLQRLRGVNTLIVGHSHSPRFRLLPDSKVLLNTGTWMQMINLDMQYLGQNSGLTYALIEYTEDGTPRPQLMRWFGRREVCENVPYAH